MNINDLIYLLLITLGAYLMPFVSKKLLLPSPVGEMLFGVGVAALWQLQEPREGNIVQFLAELGFVLLMYLAGMEIEIDLLKKRPFRDLAVMGLYYALVLLLSLWVVSWWGESVILALMMSMVAVGLLFPVLKEAGLLNRETGKKLLLLATVGEMISLITLTLYSLWVRSGFSLATVLHLMQLLGFALGAWLVWRFYRWLVWWHPQLLMPFYHIGEDAQEGGMRASLLNIFLFVTLALWLHLEIIVGAFLGGMLFGGLLHQKERIKERLGTMAYGFLVPLFFIHVGMTLPLTLLNRWPIWRMALMMSALVLGLRLICSPMLRFAGFAWEELPLLALGLSFPLTLLVAVAAFGHQTGLIGDAGFTSGLLASMITGLVYPILFKRRLPRCGDSG